MVIASIFISSVIFAYFKAKNFGFNVSILTAILIPIYIFSVHFRVAFKIYKRDKDIKKTIYVIFSAFTHYTISLTYIYAIMAYGLGEVRAYGESSYLVSVEDRKPMRRGIPNLKDSFRDVKHVINSKGYQEIIV